MKWVRESNWNESACDWRLTQRESKQIWVNAWDESVVREQDESMSEHESVKACMSPWRRESKPGSCYILDCTKWISRLGFSYWNIAQMRTFILLSFVVSLSLVIGQCRLGVSVCSGTRTWHTCTTANCFHCWYRYRTMMPTRRLEKGEYTYLYFLIW